MNRLNADDAPTISEVAKELDATVSDVPVKESIPQWVKSNAKWWNENQIGDDDFIKGMEYLVRSDVLIVPDKNSANTSNSVDISIKQIPSWLKDNAGWWADGLLSDEEFLNGIQYLVEKKIIQI